MKTHAAFMALAIAFAGAQTGASTLPSAASTKAAEVASPIAKTFSVTDSQLAAHLFPVNDEKGRLLTCIAPDIETNTETDVFKNCTLAPGRTLDEVMHVFVRAIHLEQKQQTKETAESPKDSQEKPAGDSAQK